MVPELRNFRSFHSSIAAKWSFWLQVCRSFAPRKAAPLTEHKRPSPLTGRSEMNVKTPCRLNSIPPERTRFSVRLVFC